MQKRQGGTALARERLADSGQTILNQDTSSLPEAFRGYTQRRHASSTYSWRRAYQHKHL
jgi:hypothetical protein